MCMYGLQISGNIMSSADNEERIMCHFQGKQYLGWKACRDKVKELRAKFSAGGSNGYANGRGGLSPPRSSSGRGGDRPRDSSSHYGKY
jgi:LUC7 N_terminus